MPLFFILTVPNQFRYPVCGQEPGSLMHRHRRLLTQKRIFSLAYYFTVGRSGNAVKCYQLVYRPTIYTPVCLFLYIKLQLELQAQWRLLQRLVTSSISYGKINDLTVQPVIAYIYLCECDGMHPVYITFQNIVL